MAFFVYQEINRTKKGKEIFSAYRHVTAPRGGSVSGARQTRHAPTSAIDLLVDHVGEGELAGADLGTVQRAQHRGAGTARPGQGGTGGQDHGLPVTPGRARRSPGARCQRGRAGRRTRRLRVQTQLFLQRTNRERSKLDTEITMIKASYTKS